MTIKTRLTIVIFTLFCSISLAMANVHSQGDYTIHYSLINSTEIDPKAASTFGIKRSKNRGLLNISVTKKLDTKTNQPVISNIFGQGISLAGQLKSLAFKEIKEKGAIYYIATFPIFNGERLSFDLKIQPERQGKLIPISFKQQVYTD